MNSHRACLYPCIGGASVHANASTFSNVAKLRARKVLLRPQAAEGAPRSRSSTETSLEDFQSAADSVRWSRHDGVKDFALIEHMTTCMCRSRWGGISVTAVASGPV